jgi:hypothetical protein
MASAWEGDEEGADDLGIDPEAPSTSTAEVAGEGEVRLLPDAELPNDGEPSS